MRKLATVALLASLMLILVACGGTKHTAKLPPKPCRITSTKAACQAYLIRSLMKAIPKGGTTIGVVTPNVVFRCPDRQYPALCKKH